MNLLLKTTLLEQIASLCSQHTKAQSKARNDVPLRHCEKFSHELCVYSKFRSRHCEKFLIGLVCSKFRSNLKTCIRSRDNNVRADCFTLQLTHKSPKAKLAMTFLF